MAPGALIILVEAASNSPEDVFPAVDVATKLVKENDGGQVSMSFGGLETSQELTYDKHFKETSGIVYVAAVGDDPEEGPEYPATSPLVIAVGGTQFLRTLNAALTYVAEIVWYDAPKGQGSIISTSGGRSLYEPRPSFQKDVKEVTGAWRGTPDVAAVASPGVWTCLQGQWGGVAGTSLSTPLWAGIINNAHSQKGAVPQNTNTTYAELMQVYGSLGTPSYSEKFHDITQGGAWAGVPINDGWCGPNGLTPALKGYNLCGGLGSPKL